jgi:hypothetical protein
MRRMRALFASAAERAGRALGRKGMVDSVWRSGLPKCVLALLLAGAASAYGQPSPAPAPRYNKDMGEAADGIVGIVVNQTITPNGNEFYKEFTIRWSEKPESMQYSLYVGEKLSQRYGNQVGIFWGQKMVYAAPLPLKLDALRKLCEEAAEKVQAKILALIMEQGPDETDIVREEI